jgi:hypothetical protein
MGVDPSLIYDNVVSRKLQVALYPKNQVRSTIDPGYRSDFGQVS